GTVASGQVKRMELSSFTISSSKERYVLYEPISIKFTIKNDHTQDLNGDFGIAGWRNLEKIGLRYRRENGHEWDYGIEYGEFVVCSGPKIDPLPAHSERSRTMTFLYDRARDQFIFSQPGVYELRARYSYYNFNKKIHSNVLRVVVEPPPPDETEDIIALWKDQYLAQIVQDKEPGAEYQESALGKLKKLLHEYPNSLYTKFAKASILQNTEERKQSLDPIHGYRKTAIELVASFGN
ncbi:MAG TPA: hypothetical protein PKZ53_07325, partial [Acidobacteriota bacterium]|nr:hypothetical protein [Acidobacteriota bacterium]